VEGTGRKRCLIHFSLIDNTTESVSAWIPQNPYTLKGLGGWRGVTGL
jgi:hypothetical protein